MMNLTLELMGIIIGFSVLVIIMLVMVKIAMVLIRVLFGKSKSAPSPVDSAEDTRLIQEIHQSLIKMEGRIDTLETILLAKEEYRAEAQKLHDFDRKIERGLLHAEATLPS